MSTENQVEKEKKEDEKNIKPNTEEKKIENNNLKLEERKNPLENDKKEELEKKIQRAQRFGLSEKEEIGKKMISTEEELNKRKERFKDQIKEIEGEEKEKVKGERGRIIRNKFKKIIVIKIIIIEIGKFIEKVEVSMKEELGEIEEIILIENKIKY